MTSETLKALLMLALVGGLELALYLPQLQHKHLRVRSRRHPAKN